MWFVLVNFLEAYTDDATWLAVLPFHLLDVWCKGKGLMSQRTRLEQMPLSSENWRRNGVLGEWKDDSIRITDQRSDQN